MKKLLIVLFAFTMLQACGEGYHPGRIMNDLHRQYPNSTVHNLKTNEYCFIIIDSIGTVIYVEVMGATAKVTFEEIIYQK